MQQNYFVFVWGFLAFSFSRVDGQHTGYNFTNAGRKVYRLTLNVFSGRPDPQWNIDHTYPFYNELANAIDGCRTTRLRQGLGYRGITMESADPLGHVVRKTIGCRTNVQLEQLLLDSCDFLDPAVDLYVRDEIVQGHNSNSVNTVRLHYGPIDSDLSTMDAEELRDAWRPPARKRRQAYCRPPLYDPDNWNYPSVRRRNNCYNYATNIRTDTYAQPGQGSGAKFRSLTGQELLSATARDGLIPLYGRAISPFQTRGTCLLALVLWPGVDYHFYRLDSNSLWSHKRGRTRARNVDESNAVISDPQFADRGPYTEFVSLLLLNGRIRIR